MIDIGGWRVDRSIEISSSSEAEESGSSRAWAERAKDAGAGRAVQIPCKHLQWICELFKRLNSLKNLVCTGVVCHRRHPPFATPTLLSLCLYRNVGGSSLPQTTRTGLFPFSARLRRSISSRFSLGSLTLCISNNWYSSQCKETDGAPYPLSLSLSLSHSVPSSTRCRTNNTSEKSEEITAKDKSTAHFYRCLGSFGFRAVSLHPLLLFFRENHHFFINR